MICHVLQSHDCLRESWEVEIGEHHPVVTDSYCLGSMRCLVLHGKSQGQRRSRRKAHVSLIETNICLEEEQVDEAEFSD